MGTSIIPIHGDSVSLTSPPAGVSSYSEVQLPGYYNKTPYELGLSEDILSKHVLMAGGTGCGKTNTFYFFVSQLQKRMTQNDVMIVFDTKGDYYKKFYRPGDVVIANSKDYSGITEKWNIYKEIVVDGWDDQQIYNNTSEIARSLFQDAVEKTNQPFFPNAARDLLTSILVAHLRLGEDDIEFRKSFLNNKELRSFFDSLSILNITRLLDEKAFPDLSSALMYLGDGNNGQALGVLAELQNVVRQILIGAFAQDGRFSVRNFVRSKGAKTLFIEYDLSIGATLTPIYRLLFDLALKEALGRSKSEGNVILICDEFKLLPNMQHIEDGVNFGRSLGVKVVAGIQSIKQLYEIYGEEKGGNIAAGFSSVFAFRANDSSSREYVSDLYGRNIVLEQYKTSSNTMEEEKREGKTVEDWDLNSLSVGEAIIGLPFNKPFRFQFDLYRG